MSSRLERFLGFLLDNLFDFATIAVAAVLVIRYQIKPPSESDIPEITTWILAVLGLIAVSGIWERNHRLSRVERYAKEASEFAKQSVESVTPASRFFLNKKLHHFPDTIFSTAQSIDMVGIVLGRTTREYMSILQERVRNGANLRVIICDPTNNEVLNQIVLREFGNFQPSYMKERLEGVEIYIKDIAKLSHKRGAIQLGLLPYVPAFGQISIDRNKPQGICYVELYHHKSADSTPVFEVHKSNDATWHQYFIQQYELLWSCCRVESF